MKKNIYIPDLGMIDGKDYHRQAARKVRKSIGAKSEKTSDSKAPNPSAEP